MGRLVEKKFKVVGERNTGAFKEYAELVPKAAQQFLKRLDEIPGHTGVEVSVYEQPKTQGQAEGIFYVGVLVEERSETLPSEMEYLEFQQHYAVTRGKIAKMGELYSYLDGWIAAQGYQYESSEHYIVEIYCPVENGEEEVEVHVPVKASVKVQN